MKSFNHILAKSIAFGGETLIEHTRHVVQAIEPIAKHLGMDSEIARRGAILHDIGKASPEFQRRLDEKFRYELTTKPYRHEIASLFFISLFDKKMHPPLIDMIVAHHKSIFKDAARRGILDLETDWKAGKIFDFHAGDWELWSKDALGILSCFDIPVRNIDRAEAKTNYEKVIKYCLKKTTGWSQWKGLLVAADHFASALGQMTAKNIVRAFKNPNLAFYSRKSELYPLSLLSSENTRKHTIVTAPTGAGKTDFLIRRCRSRFFYTLPFQASINSMYERISSDLKTSNPDLDIRLLHASSRVIVDKKNNTIEEKMLQDKVGSSIKILTPHQIASLVFATRGYEALLIDIQDCDVILDEIHTYSGITKAIVLKIVEVLNHFNCRIHIGTATMPSILYREIINILGKENVYQVSLDKNILKSFDRHIVFHCNQFENTHAIIDEAIGRNQKILIVCNRVTNAQNIYGTICEEHPKTKKLLIHSRFKRGERAGLEQRLKGEFDDQPGPCIVVSTQVVEVSLDISFDLMITEAAPLDSLIQRFGRINRRRTNETIGKYKPVYVIHPPENKSDSLPYELDIIQRSYQELPNGEVLHENELQAKLDAIYQDLDTRKIEQNCRFKDGKFRLKALSHEPKSVLLECLEIDSASAVLQSDIPAYRLANSDQQIAFEIPSRFQSLAYRGLDQLKIGNCPFIIPDKAYSQVFGLLNDFLKPQYYDMTSRFL